MTFQALCWLPHCSVSCLGTALTVEWTNVQLQGHPNDGSNTTSGANGGQTSAPPTTTTPRPTALGPFTFQATLNRNGDIVFAYKSVPLVISTITDEEHPVKVGLSDAYIIDRTIFCTSTTLRLVPFRINFARRILNCSYQPQDHLRVPSRQPEGDGNREPNGHPLQGPAHL
jgi:hypothetical protein